MIIDTHIHAYPDKIAAKAISKLTSTADCPAYTDGTVAGARELLKKSGIDKGILLPIATKPENMVSINNWAAASNGGSIISFGTVHPYAGNALEELDRIKELGLKGVKIHNDYQNVYIFDPAFLPIYRRCEELRLPVVFHMGYDPVSPLVHRAMPYDLIEISEKFPNLRIIGAHMGGMYAWESVYRYIAGRRGIYFDVSFVAPFIDFDLFEEIVLKHGTDRILYGSDLPWSDPKDEIQLVERLHVSDEEKERIFWKNISELLETE